MVANDVHGIEDFSFCKNIIERMLFISAHRFVSLNLLILTFLFSLV